MREDIPFVIPQKFLQAYESGAVKRFGTLLMQGNRIVGHVQEAAPLHSSLIKSSSGLLTSSNPFSLLMNAGTLASSVTANIQLEQVKSMLFGLQLLSGATLAASVAGIGVSVVGFTIVNRKLNLISEKLEGMNQKLNQASEIIKRLDIQQQARNQAQLSSLLELGEEAWARKDKFSVWQKLIDELLKEEHFYKSLMFGTISSPSIFLEESIPLNYCIYAFERLVIIHAARLQALFLCQELRAAKYYADEQSKWYSASFDAMSPSDIGTVKSVYQARQTGERVEDVRLDILKIAKPFMEGVREIQVNMATSPQLIQSLIDQNIDGYEYVKRTRLEAESPILILPASN